MKKYLLVGTYSTYGIHKLYFEDGVINSICSNNQFENCSYLCNSDNVIFNVVENSKGGLIVERDSNLSVINYLDTDGDSPCYISLDSIRNLLYTANYSDGSLNVFSINNDKSLKELIFSKKFTSHSHIHCIELSEDGNYLFLTDLGDNKLFAYKIIFSSNMFDLELVSEYDFIDKTEPRHIVINNNHIYLVSEASCELYHFIFSEIDGLKYLEKHSLLPKDIQMQDNYTGCAIKLSKDKKFIYVSIRGLNNICLFSITPHLKLVQHISCHGQTPRDLFILDNYLLCANQDSNNITIFDINKKTGELCYKNFFNINHPACIIQL